MASDLASFIFRNPDFVITQLFIPSIGAVALAYGLAWLLIRPKSGHPRPTWRQHIIAILGAAFVSALIRVLAIVTVAGYSAVQLSTPGESVFYLLFAPFVVSIVIIRFLISLADKRSNSAAIKEVVK